MHPLEPYLQAWRGTADDLLDLLPTLDADDWSRPTDLPGWSVHDVAAHLAHLESVLAGHDPGPPPARIGGSAPSSDYTQSGVDARADRSPEELIDELRRSVEARTERLSDLPDPSAKPDITPGGVDWTWEVLLRNRAIDVWSHEQDIRRAVGLPVRDDCLAAEVALERALLGWSTGLAKQLDGVDATIVVEVTEPAPRTERFELGEGGEVVTITGGLGDITRAFCGRSGIGIDTDGPDDLVAVILPVLGMTP
jgi:uncharacterized protein (TIGR03083 family)